MNSIRKYLVLLVVTALFSSCANMYIKSGNEAYKDYMYQDAINSLQKGINKKEGKVIDGDVIIGLRNLAQSYLKLNQFEDAKITYDKLIALPYANDRDRLNYGKALMSNEMYTEAEEVLSSVNFASDSGKEAKLLLTSCKNISSLMSDSALYQISEVYFSNSNSAFSPVLANGGMYFTSRDNASGLKDPYTNKKYTDLYFASNNGDTWNLPRKVGGVNGKLHDGVPTFGNEDSLMIFTRSNYDGLRGVDANDYDINTMQLYQSELQKDGTWSDPEEIRINNENYMLAHPTLSKDGNTLYFASDRQDSKGGMDIYYAKRQGDSWTTPLNAGSNINSPGNELFPVLASNDTLIFSSDAHKTLGGLDLMYSVNRDGNWSKPVHFSYPINSASDDFGMAKTSGTTGFFSSDRSGTDKIYSFVFSNPDIFIDWLIVDSANTTPLPGATVLVKNLTDGTMETLTTDENGKLNYQLMAGKEYEMVIDYDGYLTHSEKISTSGIAENSTLSKTISMKKAIDGGGDSGDITQNGGEDGNNGKIGDQNGDVVPNSGNGIVIAGDGSYIIPNIFWDYNDSNVRSDAKPYLNDLASLLKDNTKLSVQIASHCDSRGSDAYNNDLSKKRADAVKEYLISQGVPKKMLTSKGFGKKKLIHKCGDACTEAQHQENRRTEFSIL